jgi:hypothetical protein
MVIIGPIPWSHSSSNFWRDADDAQLIWFVEITMGPSPSAIDIAVTSV